MPPEAVSQSFTVLAPRCGCEGGSSATEVVGLPPPLVPYLADGVGCETPVRVVSTLFSSAQAVLRLSKDGSTAEARKFLIAISLGGTATRENISWGVIGNGTTAELNSRGMPWVTAPTRSGVVSKLGVEAQVLEVALRADSSGLQERVTPYRYTLRIALDLQEQVVAAIPVLLYVSAVPVASKCTLHETAGAAKLPPPPMPPTAPLLACPCLQSYPSSVQLNDTWLDVEIDGNSWQYPIDYGLRTCRAHDMGLPPSCDSMAYPAWCASECMLQQGPPTRGADLLLPNYASCHFAS